MFDAVSIGWRYTGSVHLIAGPDLATTTIEPYEFLEFLSGNLSAAFIASPDDLNRRLEVVTSSRGWDLRYPATDFFCFENSWRDVLTALAKRNSVILMDARGFSRGNAGVVFEINQLVNAVPLGQSLIIVDRTTDVDFLRQVVNEAWRTIASDSPNRASGDPVLKTIVIEQLAPRSLASLQKWLSSATSDP